MVSISDFERKNLLTELGIKQSVKTRRELEEKVFADKDNFYRLIPEGDLAEIHPMGTLIIIPIKRRALH